MIVIEAKKRDMWGYSVFVGDRGDMEEYSRSNFEYDTENEAELAALKFIAEQWLPYD